MNVPTVAIDGHTTAGTAAFEDALAELNEVIISEGFVAYSPEDVVAVRATREGSREVFVATPKNEAALLDLAKAITEITKKLRRVMNQEA